MKRVFAVVLLVAGAVAVSAQDGEKRLGRPDIPGTLLLDWGLNLPTGDELEVKPMGSRTFNIYYLLSRRIGDSRLSFHPGIGVGNDRYSFKLDSLDRPVTILHAADSSYFVPIEGLNVKRSLFRTTYLDLPVELRFNTHPDDPKRTLTFTLGAKVGLRMQGKSKYVYDVESETNKIKEIHPYHLSRVRYGAFFRFGGAGFNMYISYMISPLFEKGEGHLDRNNRMLSTGISFNLF